MESTRPVWRPSLANSGTAGKRVLIVEDNSLNMKLFAAMVAAEGCQVLQAENGARGLDLAYRKHPDLIIMDVQLPDTSGLEITHALKADPATWDIPIIVTSAFGYGEEIRASGCDAFIAKPIAITEFLELVETLMTQSHRAPSA